MISEGAHGQVATRDPSERLGPDDMATLRDAQFLEAALLAQRQVAPAVKSRPGWCCNCGAACLAAAIYCDDDCKSDHQHRLMVLARQQGRR